LPASYVDDVADERLVGVLGFVEDFAFGGCDLVAESHPVSPSVDWFGGRTVTPIISRR